MTEGVRATRNKTLAQVTEEIESLVRAVQPDDRGADACIALADLVVEHWDTVIKPVLRSKL